ncbi:hypothetical protein E8E13_006225 [Curvularia kusanoi]|uniref:Uncharacterized protein n=1 Tax=Curvularia kusanoi TaxID=90978 RepID=A0A9P4T8W6_CURKU|nr:hypothetical protein E8E13_006225 [Curvularia kusanoi]
MHLFDLPLELLHDILSWSIKVRGIKRGLRLRLVNRHFAREVLVTLTESKLLDLYLRPVRSGQFSPGYAVGPAYLERRVLNERSGGAPILLRVRDVAQRLCQEGSDGRDVYDYVKELCPLVWNTCQVRLDLIWETDKIDVVNEILSRSDLESDVFIAAVYTGTLPVIATWSASGKQLGQERSLVFGNATQHAARSGSHDLIAAMIDWPYEDVFHEKRAWFLAQAAEYGRAEATQFIFNFKTEQHPWVFAKKRPRPGYPFVNQQTLRRINTPSKTIYNFVSEKRSTHLPATTFGVKENTDFLIYCAGHGWEEMATYYLTLEVLVDGHGSDAGDEEQRPLLAACKYGHENVVKVLLAHGASTSQPVLETAIKYGRLEIASLLLSQGAEAGQALPEAVTKGYRTLVRALLDRDGLKDLDLEDLLTRAIDIEDEVLFQLINSHISEFPKNELRAERTLVAKTKDLEYTSF